MKNKPTQEQEYTYFPDDLEQKIREVYPKMSDKEVKKLIDVLQEMKRRSLVKRGLESADTYISISEEEMKKFPTIAELSQSFYRKASTN